ncbi:MAG: PTS transporter subunit IIC [Enterocloster asparagiformis]|nr:PTS transporter subunit IIC [Enterocloster asparagiformis]
MAVLQFVVYDILGEASLLIGLMAMVGLLIQKKPAEKVIAGTIKTIVGFLIFGIGSSAAQGALNGFQSLFVTAFGLEGVTPISEAITAQAQTLFPMVIALIMVGGFVCNLIIAKLTRFKYIFLTGGHSLFLSALLAILLKALGLSDVAAILTGSVIHGFAAALYPAIAQKSMNAVTGTDEIAIGHYCTLAYAFSGWLGSKVGNPEDSTEKIKLPGWLAMFKDYIVSVSLSIGVIYYIAAAVAGREAVEAISGGTHWLIFPLMQTLTFTGGLYVIITGVRLFLGEIVPAFVGISEKFIPGAKPALDCPVVFPYAPTATVLGFISAYAAGLICMFIMAALHTVVMIPVAIPFFFIGATAGVFGNARGGWKGCVLGAFVTGVLISVGPALIYPIMQSVGLSGTSFPETDFNLIGIFFNFIGKALGKW